MRRCAGRRHAAGELVRGRGAGRPPEVAQIACVSVDRDRGRETGLAHPPHGHGDGRRQPRSGPDAGAPYLRSAHDAGHIDPAQVAALARDIAEADAQEFRSQYPAYAADIAGETRKALDALRTDPVHRRRYDDFVTAMVYGERPEFDTALGTVVALWPRVRSRKLPVRRTWTLVPENKEDSCLVPVSS